MHTSMLVLAGGGIGSGTTKTFWDSDAGGVISTLLSIIGILVVLWALVTVARDFAAGKSNQAFKKILGTVCLAAFLFNPSLAETLLTAGSDIMTKVVNSVDQTFK